MTTQACAINFTTIFMSIFSLMFDAVKLLLTPGLCKVFLKAVWVL